MSDENYDELSVCRCGKIPNCNHEVTDACLSPEDQEFVRQVVAALTAEPPEPWWHEAAGRDPSQTFTRVDVEPAASLVEPSAQSAPTTDGAA